MDEMRRPPATDPRRSHLRHAAALVAVLTFGSGVGCSALFVDAPPPVQARAMYFDCTSSRVAPGTDVVLASIFAANAVAALMEPGRDNTPVLTTGAIAVGLGASAVYGFRVTDECRQAKGELAARLNPAFAPQWYPGGPPPGGPWQVPGPVAPPAVAPAPVQLPSNMPTTP